MSYQIQYETDKQERYPMVTKRKDSSKLWIRIATVAFFVTLLSVPSIRDFLIPGDADVTKAAFGQMIDNIREGDSLGEAVTTFCREIIANGN